MRRSNTFARVLMDEFPKAIAEIRGNENNPRLNGVVEFYETVYDGVLVMAVVAGLPTGEAQKDGGFFAMHIHEYGDCTEPFDKTGMHYNPTNQAHPEHAGDMPPLLSNDGYAFSVFFDNRFAIDDIIGRSVIIHANRDDFTTQPSGDSGEKIGCGVIDRWR